MTLTIRNCRFAFKCDKDWGSLDDVGEEGVKFCQSCQSEVYLCGTDQELVKNVKLNRCVAIFNHFGGLWLGEGEVN